MKFRPEALILLTFSSFTPRKPLFLQHETHRIPVFRPVDRPFSARLQQKIRLPR